MSPSGLRTRAGVVAVSAAALLVAGCGGSQEAVAAADSLPDLSSQGLERIDCLESSVWGDELERAKGPWTQECWRGSPQLPFDQEADDIQYTILAATDAQDVTAVICPEDALYDTAAVACRAAADDAVLYRTVVALTDPLAIVGALPDAPSEAEIDEALVGAQVEILVSTEPVPEE